MKRLKNIPCILIYGYMILPILIFFAAWLKWFWALPLSAVVIFSYYKACKHSKSDWYFKLKQSDIVKFLFALFLIALWIYFSGIGKFVYQNQDHDCRNTIFNMLVEYKWPVMEELNVGSGSSSVGLIYYIGFWLPSAVVGKVAGIRAGYYAQAVWAFIGVAIVYYLICFRLKKVRIWPLTILIMFSGLDILGHYFTGSEIGGISSALHLEWWDTPYQFSSMTTQLFWVFNQAIPAWVCTMIIFMQKNNRIVIFILSCLMISSTLPFIGLLALSIVWILFRDVNKISRISWNLLKDKVVENIKDTFTFANIVGGGSIGILSFLYLIANASGTRIMEKTTLGYEWEPNLAKWIVFIIFEIGIYAVVLYKYKKHDFFFYYIVLNLLLLSLFKLGYTNDFCMRATIPALFILLIYTIEVLNQSMVKRDYKIVIPLVAILLVGGITPLHEINRTISQTYSRVNSGEIVYQEDIAEEEILRSPNFAGNTDGNIFYTWFAK